MMTNTVTGEQVVSILDLCSEQEKARHRGMCDTGWDRNGQQYQTQSSGREESKQLVVTCERHE